MKFKRAILRTPGPDFAQGLTTIDLGKPDYQHLLTQHRAYREALESLGLECTVLDPLDGAPDAYFVEDAAVVTEQLAIITRPGAGSRRVETPSIEAILKPVRPLAHIEAPGTLDGGDVLFAEDHCFVGLSGRTNEAGAAQLGDLLAKQGMKPTLVKVPERLHLKTGVNYLEQGRMLMTPEFADHPAFANFERIVVEPNEAGAANTLWVNGTLLTPWGFPGLQARLERLGYPVIPLDMTEVAKMDGGLSCLSLRF